jgi:ATP adenylyltransferase
MQYIERGAECANPADAGCVFCDKAKTDDPERDLVLQRGKFAFVLMNLYPYNNGHLLIAPYTHTSSYETLDDETVLEIATLTQRGLRALSKALSPNGYNCGMNLGSVAGAGIAAHVHAHIVPRWSGDANFMPVIGDTKVLPESLESAYHRLLDVWE